MIAGFAVATRASDIASRFASVPELQKRTSSTDGKRLHHDRVRVTEQAGGVLAEKVDVLVPVGIGQRRAFSAYDRERERLDVDDRARFPPGHHLRARFVQAAR